MGKLYSPLDLTGNQLKNFLVHNGDATSDSKLPAQTGRLVYDTTNRSMYFGYQSDNGLAWSRLVDAAHLAEAMADDEVYAWAKELRNSSVSFKDGSVTSITLFSNVESLTRLIQEGVTAYRWGNHATAGYSLFANHYVPVENVGAIGNTAVKNIPAPSGSQLVFTTDNGFLFRYMQPTYVTPGSSTVPDPTYDYYVYNVRGYTLPSGNTIGEAMEKGLILSIDGSLYRYGVNAANGGRVEWICLHSGVSPRDYTNTKTWADKAYRWVSENRDDIVLGMEACVKDPYPSIPIAESGYSLIGTKDTVEGVTVHQGKLCLVVKTTEMMGTTEIESYNFYETWSDQIISVQKPSYYKRVGMCVVVGSDIYRYNGKTWELKYSGVDTNIVHRIETLEAYFDSNDDADKVINKWRDIVNFLEGMDEDSNLSAVLAASVAGKADKATTLAGYGIVDAKIENGAVSLGGKSIVPLVKPTVDGEEGQVLVQGSNGLTKWATHKIAVEKEYAADNMSESIWEIDITALDTLDVTVRLYEVTGLANLPVYTEVMADVTISKERNEEREISNIVRITFGEAPKSVKFRAVITA